MKYKALTFACLTTAVLVLPSAADVIYSNLQNLAIPANFDGVYLNVETGASSTDSLSPVSGWDVNFFFGGSAIWNAPTFQPVRSGTTAISSVLNLASDTVVNSSSVFSAVTQGAGGESPGDPAYGASETHMGGGLGQFQTGQEGYLGFRLDGNKYGYMRVVFTNNTGGALIKEWAYESGGSSIAVGNIVRTGSDVVLDSSVADFAVGSVITDVGGITNVVKIGTGTTTFNVANTYTGTTTVTEGTLKLNKTGATNTTILTDGSIATTSDILINGGTLEISQSEQIADTGSILMTSGAFNFGAATGLTETIDTFTNSGGNFSTGANTLDVLGATVTWSGGTNTINTGGSVKDKHVVITGGTNTVQEGGTLELKTGGGTTGLIFGGTASPTITLNSSTGTAGRILLNQDVTVDTSLTAGTAQILNGGSDPNAGFIDMNGGTRTFTINDGSAAVDMNISAAITNGALTKTGAGTLNLSGTNTYSGATTITTGRLNVNGSTAAASTISVAASTTLGGDGVINGDVTLNGDLRAGQGGVTDRTLQIVGNLTANTGSSMIFNIAGEADHDQLLLTGSVNLANTNLVIETFTDGSVTLLDYGDGASFLTSGASFYELIDGTTTNMFANVTDTMSAWELDYYGLTGTQYKMTVDDQEFWVAQGSTYLVAIPEPSLTLLGSLGALVLLRRRR